MTQLNLELILRLASPLAGDLGWTLAHFLWQGVLLAAVLQAILPLCRGAVARHNWALATLAAMCLAPVITFFWLHGGESSAVPVAGPAVPQDMAIAFGGLPPASIAMPWTGWLVGFWLAGVLLLSLRALGGLVLAQRLASSGFALPDDVLARCRALQQRLALSAPIRFLQTGQASVPMVVGWLRPVVLLPVAAIAGLPPQQLDALILHELAHIRRLDTFINLLLMSAETILFYHPAIWWVARRVRIEREHCCDDIASAEAGDVTVYVEALTALEVGRSMPALALSASGGRLKQRVARLLGAPSQTRRFSPSAMAGVILLGLVAGTIATAQNSMPASTPDFAIRVVDESVDGNARQGPAGDDRLPIAHTDKNKPESLWLKREEQIDGNAIADAHVITDKQGKPAIEFHLTPKGQEQFTALTRAYVGHRLAVVVHGAILTAPNVAEPITGGRGVISGKFDSAAEANALVSDIMGTNRPATPAKPGSRQGAISNGKSIRAAALVPATAPADAVDRMPVRKSRKIKLAQSTQPQSPKVPASPATPATPEMPAATDSQPGAITDGELNQRVALLVASTNAKVSTDAEREAIRAKVRAQLENEKAQLEEARRRHVTVSPAEVDSAVQRILAVTHLTQGGFDEALAKAGASEEVMRAQLMANLAWQKVIYMEYMAQHRGEAFDPEAVKSFANAELARVRAEQPRPMTLSVKAVELGVDYDGTISWNGTLVDVPTLETYFKSAVAENPQTVFVLKPNRLARPDRVAFVMEDARRLGVTNIVRVEGSSPGN